MEVPLCALVTQVVSVMYMKPARGASIIIGGEVGWGGGREVGNCREGKRGGESFSRDPSIGSWSIQTI